MGTNTRNIGQIYPIYGSNLPENDLKTPQNEPQTGNNLQIPQNGENMGNMEEITEIRGIRGQIRGIQVVIQGQIRVKMEEITEIRGIRGQIRGIQVVKMILKILL